MNKRRCQMAKWAVANLPLWPAHESLAEVDPDEIGCDFFRYAALSSLPVLRCRLGGGYITSSDYFYAKRVYKKS